jgi:hypothetical protein
VYDDSDQMINQKAHLLNNQTNIQFGDNFSVRFDETAGDPGFYPTHRIRKGPAICCGEKKICEEGVGFGVPIMKIGYETIFPGHATTSITESKDIFVVTVHYYLNLVNRMMIGRNRIKSQKFYQFKEYFSSIHRNFEILRGTGVFISNTLRRIFNIRNFFEIIPSAQIIKVTYTIPANRKYIQIDVDLSGVEKKDSTDITLANELGANYFDKYQDSNGNFLMRKKIGTWNEIAASEASFTDSTDRIVFSLSRVDGAKMFRGRELVPDRLAWSGIHYVLTKPTNDFHYKIKLGSLQ